MEGEQLEKRQKRREKEVDGQGGKDRQEKNKKAYEVLLYNVMKGVTERLQGAYNKMTSSSFAKLGTLPYAQRTLWT